MIFILIVVIPALIISIRLYRKKWQTFSNVLILIILGVLLIGGIFLGISNVSWGTIEHIIERRMEKHKFRDLKCEQFMKQDRESVLDERGLYKKPLYSSKSKEFHECKMIYKDDIGTINYYQELINIAVDLFFNAYRMVIPT